MKEQIKVTGTVAFIGNQEDQHVVVINITPEQREKILKLIPNWENYESIPVKEAVDETTGEVSYSFKAHTGFEVGIYEMDSKGKILESDEIEFDAIGRDSRISIYATMKEAQYKRKEFVTAYLKDILVRDFVPFEKYVAFEDDSKEEI